MGRLNDLSTHLIVTGQKLYHRGMVAGSDGNVSVRLDNDSILISPSGLALVDLAIDELVIAKLDQRPTNKRNRVSGELKPSSELAMHAAVYKARPEINACVHSHAPHATAFAIAGIEPPDDVLPELLLLVGRVPVTDYAPCGTEALADSLAPHLAEHSAFLLGNHGLLTIGRNLAEAFNRHETIEHFARIYLLARQLGNVNRLPSDEIQRLTNLRFEMENRS